MVCGCMGRADLPWATRSRRMFSMMIPYAALRTSAVVVVIGTSYSSDVNASENDTYILSYLEHIYTGVNRCEQNRCELNRCEVNRCEVNRCEVNRCELNRCQLYRCQLNRCQLNRCQLNRCQLNRCQLNRC